METTNSENTSAVVSRLRQKLNAGVKQGSKSTVSAAPKNLDAIPEEYYNLSQFGEKKILEAHQKLLNDLGIENNYFVPNQAVNKNQLSLEDGTYINFSGYNYLGLSGSPKINDFVMNSIQQYGTSASASRIVAGNLKIHDELEHEISKALGAEDCVISVGGYVANVSTIAYLLGKDDLVIHDEYSHNSIITGCMLSGAHRLSFPHNDMAALDKLLSQHRLRYKRVLIITEGVFSMDGDIADIPTLIQLKEKHKALLMVDEAHSFGTIGKRGLGVLEYFDIPASKIDILMGTLSKAFASCGGYIAGSKELILQLKYFAPGLILYSAGLSPQNTAAALVALRMMLEEPNRVQDLQENAAYFLKLLKDEGINTGPSENSPVIPVITGDDAKALLLVKHLKNEGVNVHAMLYPSVPREQVRLRFFITALHTKSELKHTADCIIKHLQQ